MSVDYEMTELIALLNKATKKYDEGHPIMTDKEWDDYYFQLEQMEKMTGIIYPNSPTQKIDYQIVNQLNKVEHNHQMLSLAKTKDWNDFLQYFSNLNPYGDVVGMVKLDGLTCSLRYLNGKLVSAETRGNGLIGEDVLHNAKVIANIPQTINYKDELIIDGEVISCYHDFEMFSNEYSNPRNFASGSIRLLDSNECANRNLTFVAWRLVSGYPEINSFIEQLNKLDELGFTVVPWTSSFDWDAKEFLVEQARQLGYPIDGLVGRFNDVAFGESLGSTAHHSKAAYAFKFYDETYPTKLKDIEWTLGRTGVLTPVAIFEPIDMEGSIVERASLHNLSVMEEISGGFAYIGDELDIFKANAIIPQVDNWRHCENGEEISLPTTCPICQQPIQIIISDTRIKNLICNNPSCEGKLINILDHFCSKRSGLDIRGLSKMTLEKLIDWGWLTCKLDIFSLWKHSQEWKQKAGFGDKSVANILASIEASKTTSLSQFIASLGIPLIGITLAKDLTKHITSYDEFRQMIKDNFDFTKYDGFAESKANAILSFDYTEADKIYELLTITSEAQKEKTSSLNGMTVVITGKLTRTKNRDQLIALIEERGGKVGSSVTKNTNVLINNDINSTSSKNVSANKLGIPIMTEENFYTLYLEK